MSECELDPEPVTEAAPRPIPLVVMPVFVGIRAYIGTSYGGYAMTYYRVDLVCPRHRGANRKNQKPETESLLHDVPFG